MSDRLPEEYEEIEYIKYSPSKTYILGGFSSQEQAIQRIEQLQTKCKSSVYAAGSNIRQIIQDYCILIPSEALCFLTNEERKTVVEAKKPLSCIEYGPTVYRFMGEQYVDSFFQSGALRLSTFRRCANLEDSNRRDDAEGRAKLIGNEEDLRVEISCGMGDNAILLCSSLSINNVKANGDIDDCCIEIRDVNKFIDAITNALICNGWHVETVIKGPCVYSDRIIARDLKGGKIQTFLNDLKTENSFDFEKMFQMSADIARDDIFFCKPIENRVENEYRMLWLLDKDVTQDTIDIVVPDARQYCRKIKFDGANNELR